MKIDYFAEMDQGTIQMLILAPGTEKETGFLQAIVEKIASEDGKFSAFMKFGKLHIIRRIE